MKVLMYLFNKSYQVINKKQIYKSQDIWLHLTLQWGPLSLTDNFSVNLMSYSYRSEKRKDFKNVIKAFYISYNSLLIYCVLWNAIL